MKHSFKTPFFQGVVEDRDDPEFLGRIRVRIHGLHSTDDALVPTDTLPWAVVNMPPTSASHEKVGQSPTGIMVGTSVWGFFMDGDDCQQPVIVGTWWGAPQGKSDLSPFVTGDEKIATKGTAPDEPADSSAPKYPHNKVTTTESGHTIEVDDTPGATRIMFYHNTGSYQEMTHEGDGIWKVARNGFDITVGDKTINVGGNMKLTVSGNVTADVSGNFDANVGGNVQMKVGGAASVQASSVSVNAGSIEITEG